MALHRYALVCVVLASVVPQNAAWAEDPSFVSFGAGWYDVVNRDDDAAEMRVEYRPSLRYWLFKPLVGGMVTSDGSLHAYAGIVSDFYFGRRIVVSPSVAPGFFVKGGGKDLDYPLEIRSQLEIAYRFDDRSRLGLAFSHMSNAGLGDRNPGSESVTLYYSIPLQ